MAEFYGNKPTSQLYLLLSKLNPSFSDEKLDSFRSGFMQINQFPEDPQFEYALPSPDLNKKRFTQLPFVSIGLPDPPEFSSFSSFILSSSSSSSSSSEGTTGTPTDVDSDDGSTSITDPSETSSSSSSSSPTSPTSTDDGGSASSGDSGCTGCNTPLESGDSPFTASRFANAVFSNIRHSITWKVNVDFMIRPSSGYLNYPPSAGFGNDTPMPEGTRVFLDQRKYAGNHAGCSWTGPNLHGWIAGFDPLCECTSSWDLSSRFMGSIGYVSGSDTGNGEGLGFLGDMRGTIKTRSITAHYDLKPSSCIYGEGSCPDCDIGEYKPCKWEPANNTGAIIDVDILDLDHGELMEFIRTQINSGVFTSTLPFTNLYFGWPMAMLDSWQDRYLEARGIQDPSDPHMPCPQQECFSTVAQAEIPEHFGSDFFSLKHCGGTSTARYGADGEEAYDYYTAVNEENKTGERFNTYHGVRGCLWHHYGSPMQENCDCPNDTTNDNAWGLACQECYEDTEDTPCHHQVADPDGPGLTEWFICRDFQEAGGFWPPLADDCPDDTNLNGQGCVHPNACEGDCVDCNGGGQDMASSFIFDGEGSAWNDLAVKLEMVGNFQGHPAISRRFSGDSPYGCEFNQDGEIVQLPFDYVQVIPSSSPKLRWKRVCGSLDDCPFDDTYQTIYFGGQSQLVSPIVTIATDCATQVNYVQEDCDPMAGAAFAGDYNGGLWEDIDTNNTLMGDVVAGDGHTGSLPRITGPVWFANYFRWYQHGVPDSDYYGGWDLLSGGSPDFKCCSDDDGLAHSYTDSIYDRGFKRNCDDTFKAATSTDSRFYDHATGGWWGNPLYDGAPGRFLHMMRLRDPMCDASEGGDPINTVIYGDVKVMPIEFYGLFECRYRYEVPVADTNPPEYQTFYGEWKLPNEAGGFSTFVCDLVAGYKVTSNYATLDAGTPI